MIKYFETIKCYEKKVFNLEYHKQRIFNTIGKNLYLENHIKPSSKILQRCKITYNNQEILGIEYFPYIKKEIKSFKLVFDDDIVYDKKYLDRENIDKLYLKRENCDEIIIIKNGVVTDTSIANIAILYAGQWIVSKDSLLEGTTKARLIKENKISLRNIDIKLLKKSSKLALLNSMIGFNIIEDYSFSL